MSTEIAAKLNELLEAERAGVETLAALKRAHPEYEAQLEAVMKDEAWSCAGLHRAVEALSDVPTTATGDFATRVMALEGLVERLNLLSRGQRWVIRRIDALLEDPLSAETQEFLREMKVAHQKNVDWCDQVAQSLGGGGS